MPYTVRRASRLNPWNTMPMRRRWLRSCASPSPTRAWPPMAMLPWSGRSSRLMH
ncbi:Uncharacterised protein [Bordetella pertussis]|nr:Uncharacterised protein [Bordetella pertussis]CFW38090.1 Uncharacterised protein [Bordetella pertussis]